MALSAIEPEWRDFPIAHVTGDAQRIDAGVVSIPTSLGDLVITLHDFGARIRLGEPRAYDYGMIAHPISDELAALHEDGDVITIESAAHRLHLEKSSLAIRLYRGDRLVLQSATDAHFVRAYRLPPISRNERGWIVHFDLTSTENIFGLGEKWGKLNKRGQLIHSFNYDALGVNAEASYKNAPFAWSTKGWGVFCHTPAPVLHGVGFAPWSQRAYGVLIDGDALDLFLLSGANGPELIDLYTDITGKAPKPPNWSLGVIASKAYYQDADELLSAAREIRARGMPCDTITLDGRAWLDTETRFAFEWDRARYPDPKLVLSELKAMNFKICVWEYPLISTQNPLFTELASKEWLLKDRETGKAFEYHWNVEPFGDVLTPLPVSGLIDFTHSEAYAYWRDRHAELFDVGVDMIKADFGEQVLDEMVASNGETGRGLHNVYSFLYNKCVYEAAEKYSSNGPFLFSRASWSGCQRFPSQWGGDPQADWEGLAASLRGGLSWGMTGAPFYATDIGGFYGDKRDPKLYVRWLQAGVFSAHFRLHGIGDRVPWSYGPQAEKAALAAIRLRYRLLPYLSAALQNARATGLPVQRAMALARPYEREAWSFDEQFFFGEDMLVAPCLNPDDEVSVYLPAGRWRRFPDRAPFEGGVVHHMRLDLDEYAVFVKEGSKIPLGPDREYIGDDVDISEVAEYWTAE
ncbi:MAG: alpha-xylosidase [Pseudomonadota bacterium]